MNYPRDQAIATMEMELGLGMADAEILDADKSLTLKILRSWRDSEGWHLQELEDRDGDIVHIESTKRVHRTLTRILDDFPIQ